MLPHFLRRTSKLKDLSGDLGRVIRSTPVGPTLENSHPFVYDLDLVLGGKLNGMFRADLLYTTASQEGMTEDSRSRRKRKTNASLDSSIADDAPSPAKGASVKKKKAPQKKTKAAPASASSSTARKKRGGDAVKGSSKKNKLNSTDPDPPTSQAMDMYERHRREFERSIARLEKADVYNFFGTEVPPEFVESYSETTTDNQQHNDEMAESSTPMETNSAEIGALASQPLSVPSTDDSFQIQPPTVCGTEVIEKATTEATEKATIEKKTKKTSQNETLRFPTSPPYNFVVIRQRMNHGRYILDRVRLENEQRIEVFTPYFKSIGKKGYKRKTKKSAIPVLHPKGVNWDLFRQDVISMCEAAIARNPEGSDVGAGTLQHAVGKIRDLLEQIYEKTGLRQNQEMAAANDRHRFSLAMDGTKNTEAAMQGKWKQDGKFVTENQLNEYKKITLTFCSSSFPRA